MSKTIKQIADELGVSKQSVQKRLSREPLYTSIQPYVYTQNGVKYIKVVGENLIKSAFSKSGIDKADNLSIDMGIDKNSTLSIDKPDLSIPLYTPIIETLQATIDTLQGQLSAKDEQIRAQQEQITALQAELERERQHAREQSDKFAVLADQAQQLNAADKKTLMLIEGKESERKLSFWERRAAKKAEKKARKEQAHDRRNEE